MSINLAKQKLQKQLGEETFLGEWLTVDQARIDRFAEATSDLQWIHTDLERAAEQSPFGGTVAHGFLTLSLLSYLTKGVDPEQPLFAGQKMVVNYGLNKVRFPHPVKTDSQIRARTELLAFEEVKGGLQMINKVTIEIKDEEKPACVAEIIFRIYF